MEIEKLFFKNRWKEEVRRTHGQSSMPEGDHAIHALEVWLDARIVTESGHDAMSLACPLDPIFNYYWLGMPSIEILTHNQSTYSHPSFHNKNSKLYGKLSEQHVIQETWIIVTLLWISIASFLILLPFLQRLLWVWVAQMRIPRHIEITLTPKPGPLFSASLQSGSVRVQLGRLHPLLIVQTW